jgi:hypothetical protein
MKTAKQELLELLERLPDEASMDTLLFEVHVALSVRRGREDASRGDVLTQDEVRQRLNESLASSGRKQPTTTSGT